MAVPKRKVSPSRRGMRRSADALKAPTYVEDKDSGELRRPHHIDVKTGMYRGRQVLTKKASLELSRCAGAPGDRRKVRLHCRGQVSLKRRAPCPCSAFRSFSSLSPSTI